MDRIALLTGGTSAEREVALRSAGNVLKDLSSTYAVSVYDFPSEMGRFLQERFLVTAVVPVFHGKGGEDGTVQGFLQTLGIPYVFSGVGAASLAMDKARTKAVVAAAGVRVPSSVTLERGQSYAFERPVVIKPVDGGSTVGTSIVRRAEELAAALEKGFAAAPVLLAEEFVEGDEFTVPVVRHEGKNLALPVIQIKAKGGFFDYESKYGADGAEELCPAPISPDLAEMLSVAAVTAHEAVGARHLSRSDFIVDREGLIWFLELNAIPGYTDSSLVPKAVHVAGLSSAGLFVEWIQDAIKNRPA